MTDSELLALAARAHGGLEYVDEMGWIHVSPDGTRGAWWHPLTDDGDALRLAVTVGMTVCTDGISTVSAICGHMPGKLQTLSVKGDKAAATRRAIVIAAAAIWMEAP